MTELAIALCLRYTLVAPDQLDNSVRLRIEIVDRRAVVPARLAYGADFLQDVRDFVGLNDLGRVLQARSSGRHKESACLRVDGACRR